MIQKNKKVAITGATGFLGKYLVPFLHICGYDVTVIARSNEAAYDCFGNDIRIFETDYSEQSLKDAFNEIDYIVHLAAQTMNRDTDPYRISAFLQVNLQLYENVLMAAKESNVKKILYISSNNVYSNANSLPFKETEPVVPSTVYGLSKLYAEKLGQLFTTKTAMKIVSLRLARLFGYGERKSVVFTKYMNLAMEKQSLEIWGEGATKIDFLYVKDAISGIERSLSQNIESGIYNLGSNHSYSVVEIAETINRICQNEGNIRFLKEKTESKYYIQMDSSKFYNATDWSPSWTLADAIANHFKSAMKNEK